MFSKLNKQIDAQSNKISILNERIKALRMNASTLSPKKSVEQPVASQITRSRTQEDLLKVKEELRKLKVELDGVLEAEKKKTEHLTAYEVGRKIGSRLNKMVSGWKNKLDESKKVEEVEKVDMQRKEATFIFELKDI